MGWTIGIRFPAGAMKEMFCPRPRPDRLWDPPSLLTNRYREIFFPGVKLTTDLHFLLKLRLRGAIPSNTRTS